MRLWINLRIAIIGIQYQQSHFNTPRALHQAICKVNSCDQASFLSFPYVCPEPVLVK